MIKAVLKQFNSMDDAFDHLTEFIDVDFESDDDEELKGAGAAT